MARSETDRMITEKVQALGEAQTAAAIAAIRGGFAMAADRSQSPAYQALTPAARKVLAVIEGKTADGGGVATISLTNLAKLCGVSDSTAFYAQRQVELLGFVTIVQGPLLRNAHRLADGWRGHDAVEAMRLRKQARLPKPKAAPKSVAKLRVARQRAVAAAYAVGRCAVGSRVTAIKSATLSPAKQGQRQTASLLPNQQRLL